MTALVLAVSAFAADPADEEDLDELEVELETDRGDRGPKEIPHKHVGLLLTGGAVYAQTPLSGDVALTLGIRPKPGLRLDATVGSWLGTAYLPGTSGVIPVAVPRVGVGIAYEGSTKGAARPWIGVGVDVAAAMSIPPAAAPIGTVRAGVDVGRSYLAWTVSAEGGVMVCPALPALAGPTYEAVAPVFAVHTGPSVRL